MEVKKQLGFIFLLLTTYAIVSLINTFGNIGFESLLFIFYKVCDLIFMIFLYKYIKYDQKQNISSIALILILLPILYFVATHFFPININKDDTTTFEALLYHQLITNSLPALIQIVGQLIISIQLIKNQAKENNRIPIQILGISFICEIALMVILPVVISVELIWPMKLYGIISLLPIFAMMYLYLNDLRIIKFYR